MMVLSIIIFYVLQIIRIVRQQFLKITYAQTTLLSTKMSLKTLKMLSNSCPLLSPTHDNVGIGA